MAAVAALERTTFCTSRLLEFCSRKELTEGGLDHPGEPLRELLDLPVLEGVHLAAGGLEPALLEQHGIAKVLPGQEHLALAYRRKLASEHLGSRLRDALDAARQHADEASVPDDLGALVAERMRADRALSWDAAIRELVLERTRGVLEDDP